MTYLEYHEQVIHPLRVLFKPFMPSSLDFKIGMLWLNVPTAQLECANLT